MSPIPRMRAYTGAHHGGATTSIGRLTPWRRTAATRGSERIASPTHDGATTSTRSHAVWISSSCERAAPGDTSLSVRPLLRRPGDIACRSTGTLPRQRPRHRGIPADASSTTACRDSDRTPAGRSHGPRRRAGRRRSSHAFTYVSHSARAALRPLTVSKNIVCSLVVIGPRTPSPMGRWSNSRIGVISAAVPVKKASSAT
jgi:hypothetical protein